MDTIYYILITIAASVLVLLSLPSCVQGLQLVRVSREGDKTAVTSHLNSGVDPNFRHNVRKRMFVLLICILPSAACSDALYRGVLIVYVYTSISLMHRCTNGEMHSYTYTNMYYST